MSRKVMGMVSIVMMATSISGAAHAEFFVSPAKKAAREKITTEVISRVTGELGSIDRQEPNLRTDLGEHLIDGEKAALETATVDVIKTILNRAYTNQTPGIAKGDHGKSQACLKGQIRFFDTIPEDLQRGVAVPGAVYEVDARLSNAEEPGRSDRSSTSQGVALKLKGISKYTSGLKRLPDFPVSDEQDFLMTSATTFFLSNIVEYSVAFGLRANGGGPLEMMAAIKKHPKLAGRLGVEMMAKLASWTALAPGNPTNILTHPYWSKHPYAWGDRPEEGKDAKPSRAIKYSVAPCENASKLEKISKANDYQKDFITKAFGLNQEVCYYLRVQQRPAGATEAEFPMEDGNVEWNETKAPFINIAEVKLPLSINRDWRLQPAQDACQNTEFSPWNGLEAHQPLSNLARGRRFVYKASALVRQIKLELDQRIKAVQ